MKRLIVEIGKFSEMIDDLLNKNKVLREDFEEFEKRLIKHPAEGDLIQGTGGLRKTRLKSASKDKSGGFRVCYLDAPEKAKLFLISDICKKRARRFIERGKKDS
ncbi:MAG: hypothetical protein ACHQT8_05970 [Chlamydiales bacterium]